MIKGFAKKLAADKTGATAVEYGLTAMMIAVVCAGAMLSVGDEVETQFNTVSSEYTDANKPASSGA